MILDTRKKFGWQHQRIRKDEFDNYIAAKVYTAQ